jgi:hypothetical protein
MKCSNERRARAGAASGRRGVHASAPVLQHNVTWLQPQAMSCTTVRCLRRVSKGSADVHAHDASDAE